jgi:hypothetical protein
LQNYYFEFAELQILNCIGLSYEIDARRIIELGIKQATFKNNYIYYFGKDKNKT